MTMVLDLVAQAHMTRSQVKLAQRVKLILQLCIAFMLAALITQLVGCASAPPAIKLRALPLHRL